MKQKTTVMPAGDSSDELDKAEVKSEDSFDFVQKQVEQEKKHRKRKALKDRKIDENYENPV